MKHGDTIKTVDLVKGENQVFFERIYPIKPINNSNLKVTYNVGNEKSETYYADNLLIIAKKALQLEIKLGIGYYAVENKFYTDCFTYKEPWGGGDGIYSFNLTNGNDAFDQAKKGNTLFVFGDTFVGRVDKKNFRRYEPLLMPNNTIAYLNPETKETEILINQGKRGQVESFFDLDKKIDIKGTIIQNVLEYDRKQSNDSYLSGLNAKEIILDFDFSKVRHITKMSIINYYREDCDVLSNRGIKSFELYKSLDNVNFEKVTNIKLKRSKHLQDEQSFNLNIEAKVIRFKVIDSYNTDESITGLSKVKFYQEEQLLRDVIGSSNTVYSEKSAQAWIWLQDGVVIKDKLYFFPLIIVQDLNQPEGLQFAVKGVVLMEVPIKKGKIIPEKAKQKLTPFYVIVDGYEYFFGGAIMNNTHQGGALNPDGYIYIYGYRQQMGLRQTLVARVKEDNFTYFDDYEYFTGSSWSKDIKASAPLFDHVSCEFSVSEIRKGRNKGKYISIFTYDTSTINLAFTMGETPYGPFSKPQIFYKTREVEIFKETTYTYNAKAHPHLSESNNILVSYNTNTYSSWHNRSNANIYHARFVNLIDTDFKENKD